MLARFRAPCPCCGKGDIADEVKIGLVELEAVLGREVRLTGAPGCGFRCGAYNARTPGASPVSQHMLGLAADITSDPADVDEIAGAAGVVECFHLGGIGRYPKRGFVHVDARKGAQSRWVG